METPLTPHEAIGKLQDLIDSGSYDRELEHVEADDILLSVLRFFAQKDLVDKYLEAKKKIGFWYA